MRGICPGCLAMILFLLGGCAACKDCGTIKKRHEVTNVFTSNNVIAEYNYFYNGPFNTPKAIMGIDKRLMLEGTFWTPIDLTKEQLTQWVAEISSRPGSVSGAGASGRFEGFEILDPDGVRVGIWYSNYDWGVFKFPEENKVIAYSPSFRPGSGAFSVNSQN